MFSTGSSTPDKLRALPDSELFWGKREGTIICTYLEIFSGDFLKLLFFHYADDHSWIVKAKYLIS